MEKRGRISCDTGVFLSMYEAVTLYHIGTTYTCKFEFTLVPFTKFPDLYVKFFKIHNNNFFSLKKFLKARFHASEILREKMFMRNMDGCTWIIPLNFLFARKKFASAVSRNQFYSLPRRKERENSI